MKVALDTNILVYAEAGKGLERRQEARSLLVRLRSASVLISIQVCGELYNVLTRKLKRSRAEAASAVHKWRAVFEVIDTTDAILTAALDLAIQHHLSIWDAVQIAAAAQSGCSLLLTEDLQHGFCWGGLTVVNPFTQPQHPLLAALLAR